MIVVDTDVVAAPLRRVPEPRVAERPDARALEALHPSAAAVAELDPWMA